MAREHLSKEAALQLRPEARRNQTDVETIPCGGGGEGEGPLVMPVGVQSEDLSFSLRIESPPALSWECCDQVWLTVLNPLQLPSGKRSGAGAGGHWRPLQLSQHELWWLGPAVTEAEEEARAHASWRWH